ncbi:MAG: 8-amino-7-oxononanoate synthase [Proteobacteria bacterium]|nr:8-amino-7-oxononanoate synthase [Desulfobulbaceae bacterium]MBU4151364.1 8-amino-7-oxononanoate synthase [Pseudomonadota bacterium]
MAKVNGQTVINFSSNDYLGLARHPALVEGSARFIHAHGTGSTASRLVCGTAPTVAGIETHLASLKEKEAALIMNSGFQANVSLIPALANRKSLILADRLCHNSIIQGVLLSRARLLRFRHNDLSHLEELLGRHAHTTDRILIITESVYSMDGDRCDLDTLITISQRYGALVMVDEAHATGVLGYQGMGLACGKDIDIIMGTFGKGLGSYGAYVVCSAEIREYLINYCTGFIYSTALPPPVLGAIDAALTLVPTMDSERDYLQNLAQYLRNGLHALKLFTGDSTTQIVPMIIGNDQKAVSMSQWLLSQCAILATAIRPPTVEQGSARIRLALSCHHTKDQIDTLLRAIKTYLTAHP